MNSPPWSTLVCLEKYGTSPLFRSIMILIIILIIFLWAMTSIARGEHHLTIQNGNSVGILLQYIAEISSMANWEITALNGDLQLGKSANYC